MTEQNVFAGGNTHEMRLDPEPFEKIKTGRKRIELRLWDEKRKKIGVGDRIVFVERVSGEQLVRRVCALHVFCDFETLFKSISPEKCGFDSDAAQAIKAMERFYPKEKQRENEVVGIELEDERTE